MRTLDFDDVSMRRIFQPFISAKGKQNIKINVSYQHSADIACFVVKVWGIDIDTKCIEVGYFISEVDFIDLLKKEILPIRKLTKLEKALR